MMNFILDHVTKQRVEQLQISVCAHNVFIAFNKIIILTKDSHIFP